MVSPDYIQLEDALDPAPDEVVTEEEIIDSIAGKPAEFTPGEQSNYCNTNYILLSMIAEEATGTPWQDLVQAGILDEIGLSTLR